MASPKAPVQRTTLSRAQCLDLLGTTELGRVIVSVRALPAALPARISVLDADHLLLASPEEAVVAAAERFEVLSVQIDGLEPSGATWSVLTSGIARLATDEASLDERMRAAHERGAQIIELPMSVVVGERVE